LTYEIESLRRILSIKLLFEGGSSWVTREFIEILEDYLMERLPLMINSFLEPYGLEASILGGDACRLFPGEASCKQLVVVGLYPADSEEPAAYALYRLIKGENTFEFHLYKIVEKPGSL